MDSAVSQSLENRLADGDVEHVEYDRCNESELRIADKSKFSLTNGGKRFDILHVLIRHIFRHVLGR